MKIDLSMMKERKDLCTLLNSQVTYKDNIKQIISNHKDLISSDKRHKNSNGNLDSANN